MGKSGFKNAKLHGRVLQQTELQKKTVDKIHAFILSENHSQRAVHAGDVLGASIMEGEMYININTDKIIKQLWGYGRFLLLVVIALALVVIYPFITSFVYIGARLFGQPISYLAGGLVANLYAPLLAAFVVMSILIMVRFFYLNVFINKNLLGVEAAPPKVRFKGILVVVIFVVVAVHVVCKSLLAEWNLVQDIPHLAHADFATAEGIVHLYTVPHDLTEETKIQINGIRMEGGIVDGETLVDGATYHIEYLPHSQYVVKYHRVSR